MGSIVSITISLGVDYLTGSLTAMVWEKVFNPYDASKGKFMQVSEGLLQLSATVTTSDYLRTLITPKTIGDAPDLVGMVAVLYFALLFSPNMVAKLRATHIDITQVLGF
jgi:hypothetical protein